MIVSASRRTDIPAFYPDWFYKRLEENFVYVRNPMNPKQVSELCLTRETVDCFVFWTKNPAPMLERLSILDQLGYPYYFQFTLTPYGPDLEPGLPHKNDIIRTFRRLSERIGPERVVWRYDPILLGGTYDIAYHCEWFEKLCRALEGYTRNCVISFLDMYTRIKKKMQSIGIRAVEAEEARLLASVIGPMAADYGMRISTCSEAADFSEYGISKGKCIDDRLIERITGLQLDVKKDDTQRESCGCVKSVDMGTYHTCAHFCRYCYANLSPKQVEENRKQHNPDSPFLIGGLRGDDKITSRDMKSVIKYR